MIVTDHAATIPITISTAFLLFIFSQPASSAAHFLPTSIVRRTEPPRGAIPPSLSHARELGIDGDECEVEYYHNPDATHPNFESILNVRFQNLSRQHFRQLGKLYGAVGGFSSVRRYDRARKDDYEILDFLSPIIQATWGLRFRPENELGPAPLFLSVLWLCAEYFASQG